MNLQTEKSMELRKDVRKFAEDNPEIAAQMVKSWCVRGWRMSETATGGAATSCKTVDETAKGDGRSDLSWREKASQLYQYMDPDDVEQITLEVAKLGYVDAATTEDVLNEYYQMCLTNKAVTEGGLEYARAVLEKAFGEQAADNLLEKQPSPSKTGNSLSQQGGWQVAVCGAAARAASDDCAGALLYRPGEGGRRGGGIGLQYPSTGGGEHRQYGKRVSDRRKNH